MLAQKDKLGIKSVLSGVRKSRGGDLGGDRGDGPPQNFWWGDGGADIPPQYSRRDYNNDRPIVLTTHNRQTRIPYSGVRVSETVVQWGGKLETC